MSKIRNIIILLVLAFVLASCNHFNKEPEMDADYLYSKALFEFKKGNLFEAKKYFQKISDNFPYKDEAIEAQVFLIWINYLENDYIMTEVTIDSFLKYYVANKYTDWANYMRALIVYEQVNSSDTDQSKTLEALNAFSVIYKKYKGTLYEQDAYYKIDVIKYNLALRNMKVGFFYLEEKSYIAALSRYQNVVMYFQDTIFVQEAMYRLVYLWLTFGVEDEAYRVASVLGYNYPSSEWYKKSLTLIKRYTKDTKKDLPRNVSTN